MYRNSFGTQNQIRFNNESEYYQTLGYLAKPDETTSIHWEYNEKQGAWGSEGRIHFYIQNPNIPGAFSLTAGTGNIIHRTNCNEFIQNLVQNHNFQYGNSQNIQDIRDTIPEQYINDFNDGLTL
jgi:hypothetical protein